MAFMINTIRPQGCATIFMSFKHDKVKPMNNTLRNSFILFIIVSTSLFAIAGCQKDDKVSIAEMKQSKDKLIQAGKHCFHVLKSTEINSKMDAQAVLDDKTCKNLAELNLMACKHAAADRFGYHPQCPQDELTNLENAMKIVINMDQMMTDEKQDWT